MMQTEVHIESRKAKRQRNQARVAGACELRPDLQTDRFAPFRAVMHCYRAGIIGTGDHDSPLGLYVAEVRREVEALEASTASLPRALHRDGATIRRALCFLRTFGRLSSLDFDSIPDHERGLMITWLRLEYRWCFAAAGTTASVFKVAIGRTGAR